MKKSQIILAIIVLILVGVFLGKTEKKEPIPLVTNFEECANAGNPIMESYPRQCIHEGKNFVEIIEEVVLPPHSPTEGADEPVIVDDGDMAPKCIVTGCSGQICSDEERPSTCEFLPKYACYQSATCERQISGECGWTETPTLRQCLNGGNEIISGYITGQVTIGPNCPVEQEGKPCPTPPEAYSSRKVVVSYSKAIKATGKIDAQGNFNIAIAPGSYTVEISPAGIGPGEKKSVTVKSSQTTTVNFDIDTGIR